MAYQLVNGMCFPTVTEIAVIGGGSTAFSNYLMNATGQKVASVFRVPATGTLHHVEFFLGTVTVGGTLKISFQDVDIATGNPDGVVDQFRTMVVLDTYDNAWAISSIMTDTGLDGGTPRSVTKGAMLSAVIEFNTFGGTESLNIQALRIASVTQGIGNQYTATYSGAAWTKQTLTGCFFALVYSDGSVYPMRCAPITNSITLTAAISQSTSPDEAGNLIQVPFACKVDGLYIAMDLDQDCEVVLYDGVTVLATVAVDKDIRPLSTGVVYYLPIAEITLTAGSSYRIVLKPSTVTSINLYRVSVTTATLRNQWPGGQFMQWTQRTDAGAWTEIATTMAFCGFCISQLSDTVIAGGSGGVSRTRVQGGM